MVVIRGTVDDLQDALDDVQDELDATARKAKAAGEQIDNALSTGEARRDLSRTEAELEDVGDEIEQTAAKAEALDGKDIDIDVDHDNFDLTPVVGGSSGGGGGGGGGRDPINRKFEQDLSRLNDEVFALVNIFRKMSMAGKSLILGITTAIVSFATLIGSVGGLATAAAALATKLGDRELRRSMGVARRAFVEVGRQFVDAMAPVIRNQIVPFLLKFAQELRSVIPELVTLTRRNLPELTTALTGMVDGVVGFAQVMETVTDGFDLIKDAVLLLETAMLRGAQEMLELAGLDIAGSLAERSAVFSEGTLQERMDLLFESIQDMGRSLGFAGETFLGVQIRESDTEDGPKADASGLRGPSMKAVERLRKYRRELEKINQKQDASLLTRPEVAQQKLKAAESALDELLKLDANAAKNVAPETIEALKDRVDRLRIAVVTAKGEFDLSQLQGGFKGVISKAQKSEKRLVKMVQEMRKLPGVALDSKEAVRSFLSDFGVADDRIEQVITRLRGITPLVDKIRKSFQEFLNQLGQGFAETLTTIIFQFGKLEEQALQNQLRISQLNERMFKLADEGTKQAAKRMRLLRKEAARLREETTAIGIAFEKMKRVALRALEQLIQQIIVAIGKAAILAVLNSINGVSGASTLVGGIGQLLNLVSSGGGSGGSSSMGTPGVGGNANTTKQINLVPKALPNGDLGFAMRENTRRRERLGLEVS